MGHRLVVIGISDYGRLNQPLPGCLNDMGGWRDHFARTLNLNGDQIRLLSDARATRSAILERIGWLLADTQPGDQRIFVFAGHGAQLVRRNSASGVLDNQIDETIVAYPGESTDYEDFMIFDSDLADIVDRSGFSPGARLTLIYDSCHSGGMLRVILDRQPSPPLPRCLHLPEDLATMTLWKSVQAPVIRSFGALHGAHLAVPRLIVAAASADQSAWDDRMPNGQRHGVFSYYALLALANNPAMSASDLIAAVTPSIGAKFPQRPVLLGSPSRFPEPLTL